MENPKNKKKGIINLIVKIIVIIASFIAGDQIDFY